MDHKGYNLINELIHWFTHCLMGYSEMENKSEQVSHGRHDFEGYILSLVPFSPPFAVLCLLWGEHLPLPHTYASTVSPSLHSQGNGASQTQPGTSEPGPQINLFSFDSIWLRLLVTANRQLTNTLSNCLQLKKKVSLMAKNWRKLENNTFN